jgi:hypothetical protein
VEPTKITKLEAARRQLDAAIRMLFAGEDPLAIHALAMAAFRLLRDLSEKQGSDFHETIRRCFRPGMEREAWRALQGPANFLKHADHDPEAELSDINEELNDLIILLACCYYTDLGGRPTPEMTALTAWAFALNLQLLREDVPASIKRTIPSMSAFLVGKTRPEQLSIGRDALRYARSILASQ